VADRVKVACINWSVPDRPGWPRAPRGLTYVLRGGEMVADDYSDTWEEALAKGNDLAIRLHRMRGERS
jgi:hypothetical protein